MKASDIMTVGATTVRPDTTIEYAARVMLEHAISGLPVVDAGGHLVGIVTEGDLLRREEIATELRRPRWLEFWLGAGKLAQEYAREHGRKVTNVMSRDVASIGPEATVGEIVDLMEARGVKRLPVVDGDRVVGIVSRSNLLRALSRRTNDIPQSVIDDLAIRKGVMDEIAAKAWAAGASVDIVVRNGIVDLNGSVEDDHVREAMRVIAENAPGTIRVVDNLRVVRPRTGYSV